MKISLPRQNSLKLPHGEQPAKHLCRHYSSITRSVMESSEEKQRLWRSRLEPDSSTDCVPADNCVMSSFTSNDALLMKQHLKSIQPRLTWNYMDSESDQHLQRLAQPTSTCFQGQRQENTQVVQDHAIPGHADVGKEKFVDLRNTDSSPTDEEHCSSATILISECHCEHQSLEGASEILAKPRVKLLCSFGGRIMARPVDGKLRYAGGETRIVSVCRGIRFIEFMSKMSQCFGSPLGLKYQLPDQDLDALISVSSDDDLQNMMEEYDKNGLSGSTGSRFRLLFFTTPADVELAEARREGDHRSSYSDQRYVDAINGNLPEEETAGLHPSIAVDSGDGVGRLSSLEQAIKTTQCSPPFSSPSSPTSAQAVYRKPPGLLDLSLQDVNEGPNKPIVSPFRTDGETDQYSSGNSRSTPYRYQHDSSHFDSHFSQIMETPRISLSLSSSQQSYHPQQVQHQHQHYHLHQQQPPQQYHHQHQQHHHGHQPHQSHQYQHDGYPYSEGDTGRGECLIHEMQKQSQYHQLPYNRLLQNAPVHTGCSWNAEHHGTPRSTQLDTQMLHGLAPAPPYQIGSSPSSPRVGVYDHQGKCSCGLQHSQVHRGITVSIGEQPYTRWPPFQNDQDARKQALRVSSRFHDRSIYGADPASWQQANYSPLACEVEHKEFTNHWPFSHGRHSRDMQSTDCLARIQNAPYTDPPGRNGEILPSHDRTETGMRCACSNCVDNRRQQMEAAKGHSAYMEAFDHAADWPLYRQEFDADGSRVAIGQKTFPRASAMKDGDHEKISGVETGLYFSQLSGNPESRMQNNAAHVDRSRKTQLSTVAVTGSLTAFNDPMLRLAPIAAKWPPKPTKNASELAVSRIVASAEPKCYYYAPCSQEGQEMELGKDSQTTAQVGSLSAVSGSEKLERDIAFSDARNDAFMTSSFYVDSVVSGAGRVESDAGQLWSPNCGLDSRDQGGSDALLSEQGDSRLLSPDVIPLSPMLEICDAGQSLTSPLFDQSPSSSSNMRKFSFVAGKPSAPPPDRILDNEPFTLGMSVTGQLADSMASSVLDCCSDETLAWEMSDFDQDSCCSPTEEANITKVEEGTKMVSAEANILKLQQDEFEDHGRSFAMMKAATFEDGMEAAMDKTGSTDGHQEVNAVEDSGVGLGRSNKTSEQEEAATIERNEPSLSEPEAEAIARGLQIIKNSNLEDMKELGSGTYGTVFHGKWRGSDVAIKRIKASCFTGPPSDQERLIADFWREACTLGQLHHPNVVAFYGVVPDGPDGTLATVTEFMVNGSLKQVLHKKDRTIDRRKRLFIAMDAAFGMEYLHSKNIVHFDLKCENLLVNMRDAHRPICKVGDFGLSKVKHHTLVSGGVRGTLPWMAPELLSGNGGMVSEKVDVFSFGIVMWELLTGEEPYANMHCGAIIGGIANNTLRPSIPSWCDPGWRSLMERCWGGNPTERPPFSEVAKELRAIAATMNLK